MQDTSEPELDAQDGGEDYLDGDSSDGVSTFCRRFWLTILLTLLIMVPTLIAIIGKTIQRNDFWYIAKLLFNQFCPPIFGLPTTTICNPFSQTTDYISQLNLRNIT